MNFQPPPGFIDIFVLALFSERLNYCCHLGVSVFPSVAADVLSFPGSCFVRTDQLDGETDWKLRLPVACTQRLPTAAVSRPVDTTFTAFICVSGKARAVFEHHYIITSDNNLDKRLQYFLILLFPRLGFNDKYIYNNVALLYNCIFMFSMFRILASALAKVCCCITSCW